MSASEWVSAYSKLIGSVFQTKAEHSLNPHENSFLSNLKINLGYIQCGYILYIEVSVVRDFFMKIQQWRKLTFVFWNIEWIRISEPLKTSRINPNIFKCREFGESKAVVFDPRRLSDMTSKYCINVFIIVHDYKWKDRNWCRSIEL